MFYGGSINGMRQKASHTSVIIMSELSDQSTCSNVELFCSGGSASSPVSGDWYILVVPVRMSDTSCWDVSNSCNLHMITADTAR